MRGSLALGCAIAAAVSACAASNDLGFAVEVSLAFDASLADADLQRVAKLVITAGGDETYTTTLPLGHSAGRSERFVYRPSDATRRLALTILAEDAGGEVVAAGRSAEIQLSAGQTSQLQIAMLGAGDGDMSMPFSCPASAQICEDFENGLGASYAPVVRLGSIVPDTTHAHRGTHALHAHVDAVASTTDSPTAVLIDSQVPNPAGSSFHYRAYYYIPTGASPPGLPMAIASVLQNVAQPQSVTVALDGAHLGLYDSLSAITRVSTADVPLDRWICVEWSFTAGSPGALSLSVDGQPLADLMVTDTTTASPALSQLLLGLTYDNILGAVPALDLWIDDVVVDSGPIGCN